MAGNEIISSTPLNNAWTKETNYTHLDTNFNYTLSYTLDAPLNGSLDMFNNTLNDTLSGTLESTFNSTSPQLNDTLLTQWLSQSDIESIDGYYQMADDVYIYGIPCVILPGLVGNLLCILTLRQTQFANNDVALLLIILAVVDLFALCFSGIPDWMKTMEISYFFHSTSAMCKAWNYIDSVLGNMSYWLLALITGERVLIIMWPIKHKERVTRKAILMYALIICLVSLAPYIYIAMYGVSITYTIGTTRVTDCFVDDIKMGESYDLVGWFVFVLRFLLPFVLIMSGNLVLIVKLVHRSRSRKKLTGKGKGAGAVTMMLMTASLAFLITVGPWAICYTFLNQLFPGWRYDHVMYAKFHFTNELVTLVSISNHTVNFFIYFTSCSQFREALNDVFKSFKSQPLWSSHTDDTQTSAQSIQRE